MRIIIFATTLKMILNTLFLIIIPTSVLSVVKSEGIETSLTINATNDEEEVFVRLCCNESSVDSDCFDLKLMPKSRNLNFEFTPVKGKLECVAMFEYDQTDLWMFLPVSYLVIQVLWDMFKHSQFTV